MESILANFGWGRYIAERDGKIPVLWQATTKNLFLEIGYLLLAPSEPKPNAVYMPQATETPVTPIWDHAQISCDGKPANEWGSPGTYLYKSNKGVFHVVVLQEGDESPKLGVVGPGVPFLGAGTGDGTQNLTTELGTFQATVFSASNNYNFYTGQT